MYFTATNWSQGRNACVGNKAPIWMEDGEWKDLSHNAMFMFTCQRAKAPKVHGGPTQHTWGPLFTRRRAAEESIKIPDRNKLARVGTFHRCITASHLAPAAAIIGIRAAF